MMFAEAGYINIADNHHLIVVFCENGVIDDIYLG
jgi:hypothetical protein